MGMAAATTPRMHGAMYCFVCSLSGCVSTTGMAMAEVATSQRFLTTNNIKHTRKPNAVWDTTKVCHSLL
jgi:hypothetical protein